MRWLKLAAPYIAVAVFWVGYQDAWLTILAYHAQILWWSRHRLGSVVEGWNGRSLLRVALPAVLFGPLVYLMLPYVARLPVGEWLARYGLAGPSFALMVSYFSIVHPVLEQEHWAPLRQGSVTGHAAFAGYHAVVLYTLLPPVWLAVTAGLLVLISVEWEHMTARNGGPAVALCTHVLGDAGIILAAWALT